MCSALSESYLPNTNSHQSHTRSCEWRTSQSASSLLAVHTSELNSKIVQSFLPVDYWELDCKQSLLMSGKIWRFRKINTHDLPCLNFIPEFLQLTQLWFCVCVCVCVCFCFCFWEYVASMMKHQFVKHQSLNRHITLFNVQPSFCGPRNMRVECSKSWAGRLKFKPSS